MKVWCNNCKEYTDTGIVRVKTGVVAPDGFEEVWDAEVCASCGSEDIDEAKECGCCGDYFVPHKSVSSDYCDTCIENAVDEVNAVLDEASNDNEDFVQEVLAIVAEGR